MNPPRLVTFDFYTALVDYEGSLLPVLRAACPAADDPVALVRAWRAKQLEGALLSNSLGRGRVPFRELTRRALVYTCARARQPLPDALAEKLVAAWDALSPWPDAAPTLAALKARGHTIALLSNGDESMLRAGLARFDVAFDHVFASDQAGFYKPHPAIYALPLARLGLAASDVLHVAGSGNDAAGAKLAGLRCAWSNRSGEPMLEPGITPDYPLRDLAGLLRIL
ncbi:MAG: haloacid dehalogenase type II [Rudaea sp.]